MKYQWMILGLMLALPAMAQTPHPEDIEPGVNTSATPPTPQSAPVAPSSTAAAKPAGNAPVAAIQKPTAVAKGSKSGKAMDRLDLDTTQITGNKELPKVMYVVPWKHSDLGDLTGKPANSLVDEVLQPVDRDVFNRSERYYHTVAPEKSPSAAPDGTPSAH